MGLSIAYKGSIRNIKLIDSFINEVADICSGLEWDWTVIKDNDLHGIIFSAQNCEPCIFSFNKDGVLTNPFIAGESIDCSDVLFVKTQYAGVDVHIAIISLYRYLFEKYFSAFQVIDEGQFWETSDKAILERKLIKYQQSIDMAATILGTIKTNGNESVESLAGWIEQLLREKRGGQK